MLYTCFSFEEFELDAESCELQRSGQHVRLERIPMQLLILLLENPSKLIRRETIIERLWGNGVFLEAEHSINTAVNKLRAVLRDDPRNPRFIRTVVGQGYCFIARVNVLEPVPVSVTTFELENGTNGTLPDRLTGNDHFAESSATEPPPVAGNAAERSEQNQQASENPTFTVKKPFGSGAWIITALVSAFVTLLIAWTAIHLMRQQKQAIENTEAVTASVPRSIAVLPFRNLAQSASQDYLVDGLTDQLTTNLARSTSLRVISQRSAMQYKNAAKPMQEIAKELNVDAIVEGSYLRAGKQVRITAQLLDARHDQHLWAQTYDESDKDLLAAQDQVTNDITQQIAIVLKSKFTRSKLMAANPQARVAYLRGRDSWNERTLSAVTTSIKYYTEAIRADPNYAQAYAALAEAYVLLAEYGHSDASDNLWKAQYAAERALDLDNSLGEAHTALGAVKVERDWDWAGAEKEYLQAIQLNPADATAHHWYSLHLSRMGKPKEAETEIQRAIALDPLSLMINTDAADTAYLARNPQLAITRVDGVLALKPDFAEAHLTKGKILEQLHRYQDAITEYQTAKKLFDGGTILDAMQANALALAGQRKEAVKILKQLETKAPPDVAGSQVAIGYCGLGDIDQAMQWLESAYQSHAKGIGMIGVDPLYDGCQADPRFKELLVKLKLTPGTSSL